MSRVGINSQRVTDRARATGIPLRHLSFRRLFVVRCCSGCTGFLRWQRRCQPGDDSPRIPSASSSKQAGCVRPNSARHFSYSKWRSNSPLGSPLPTCASTHTSSPRRRCKWFAIWPRRFSARAEAPSDPTLRTRCVDRSGPARSRPALPLDHAPLQPIQQSVGHLRRLEGRRCATPEGSARGPDTKRGPGVHVNAEASGETRGLGLHRLSRPAWLEPRDPRPGRRRRTSGF